jgi:hypothetical protein
VLDAWVQRRRLHRVHQGVYSVGRDVLRMEGRRLAAVLACGPGAVLSARTAAAHWGLLTTEQTRIEVTALRGRHGAPGIRLHRSRSLDAQDTTSHLGIPITTVHRTLLDPAAQARGTELANGAARHRGRLCGQEPHNRPSCGVAHPRTRDDRARSRCPRAASPR